MHRGRFVFSSSEDLTRASEAKGTARSSALALWLTSAAENLFATLFPADCRLCGQPLTKISRLPVCQTCLAAIHPIEGGRCVVCGERILSPHAVAQAAADGQRCILCRRVEPPFLRAVSYGSYEGGLRELIHLLKYEQVRSAIGVLGRMLAMAIGDLQPEFSDAEICVLPVPLHRRKLRQRGFNQSELIAYKALTFLPEKTRWALHKDVLVRQKLTQSQIGLTGHQRRENLRGAFVVTKPEIIFGREVILVDDVFTTGTTVSECARILRRNGASNVWVATVARTLKAHTKSVQSVGSDDARLTSARA